MITESYSLTPDSAHIQPEPEDFEAVEREFGPLPLDATEQEAAHRYRLAQATKILRLRIVRRKEPTMRRHEASPRGFSRCAGAGSQLGLCRLSGKRLPNPFESD
jgi:hypothetical protein